MNWTHLFVLVIAIMIGAWLGTHHPTIFGPLRATITGA